MGGHTAGLPCPPREVTLRRICQAFRGPWLPQAPITAPCPARTSILPSFPFPFLGHLPCPLVLPEMTSPINSLSQGQLFEEPKPGQEGAHRSPSPGQTLPTECSHVSAMTGPVPGHSPDPTMWPLSTSPPRVQKNTSASWLLPAPQGTSQWPGKRRGWECRARSGGGCPLAPSCSHAHRPTGPRPAPSAGQGPRVAGVGS